MNFIVQNSDYPKKLNVQAKNKIIDMFFLKKQRKKRCVVVLSGGIGNQMFQYAFARSFSLENDCELIIDHFSGFFRDKLYKRNYELNKFKIENNSASYYLIFILLLHRCFFNQSAPVLKLSTKFLGYHFIIESDTKKFIDSVHKLRLSSTNWIIGYWQSENYFKKNSEIILNDFELKEPTSGIFSDLKEIYNSSEYETVAVGIRLYEESVDPSSHVSNGKLKSISDIQIVIDEMLSQNRNLRFLIFSTSNSAFVNQLVLPNNSLYLTAENGYSDTISSLWAISKCKHHIISSSSFYWWGAWLSNRNWKKDNQMIYVGDNFFNSDSYPLHWKKFR